mgnify:CR=1 FL=1
MNTDRHLFSLDGIASEKYLNKKGLQIKFKYINNAVKKLRNSISLIEHRYKDIGNNKTLLDFKVYDRSQLVSPFKNNPELFKSYEKRRIKNLEKIKNYNLNFNHSESIQVMQNELDYDNSNLTKLNVNKHIQMYFARSSFLDGDASVRLVIPKDIFLKKEKLKKYKLYKLVFETNNKSYIKEGGFTIPTTVKERDTILKKEGFEFHPRYFGITKRNLMERIVEHRSKSKNNSGFLLHNIWNQCMKKSITNINSEEFKTDGSYQLIIELCEHADTLNEIYDYEEAYVDLYSLRPYGLNAIPGGYAGIKELHKLNLLGSTKNVSLQEREKAVERFVQKGYKIENRKSPVLHERVRHRRKLASGRKIWVESCSVGIGVPRD